MTLRRLICLFFITPKSRIITTNIMRVPLTFWRPIITRYGRRGAIALVIVGLGVVAAGGTAVRAFLLGGGTNQTSSNSIQLDKGLVGYWKLDGNTKDSSPFRHNGTMVGTATPAADRKGKATSAYDMDGATNSIEVANTSKLDIKRTVTMSAWVKMDSYNGKQWIPIFHKGAGTSANNRSYSMWVQNNGSIHISTTNGTLNTSGSSPAGSFTLNQWTHVAGVIDRNSGFIRFYINGTQVQNLSVPLEDMASNTQPLRLGWTNEVSALYGRFDGMIDDARLYDRALNASEVQALAEGYSTDLAVGSGEKNLIGHWAMDGNTNDSSPIRAHGVKNAQTTLAADRKGRANSAYSFDGSAQIQVPYNAKHRPTNRLTLSAWISPSDVTSTADQQIVNNTENGGYALMFTLTDKVSMLVETGGSYKYASFARNTLPVDQWSHIAGTYDGSTVKLYVNGQQVDSQPASGVIGYPSTNNAICIGTEAGSGNCLNQKRYTGKIDDVRIYGRALSANEIKTQYESYDSQINIGGSPQGGEVNLARGLVGSWSFSGNLNDSSVNRTAFTSSGGPTLTIDRKGRANSAYSFDGTDDYMVLSSAKLKDIHNVGQVSYSMWYYYSGSNTNFFLRGSSNDCRYEPIISATSSRLSGCSSSGVIATYTSQFGWNHIVVVIDKLNNIARVYLNGTQVGSRAVTTITSASTNPPFVLNSNTNNIHVGATFNSSGVLQAGLFSGGIDDIRIYNRAVSAGEVTALYEAVN